MSLRKIIFLCFSFFIVLPFYAAVFNKERKIFYHGRLRNGLNYYIIPQNKANNSNLELRLILPVGSINEPENSPTGVAHFLEHIAFEGSKHFPKNNMTNYIEHLGASFGYGMNAYTGYDRTIFSLTLPQIERGVTDSALCMASDWLCNLSMEKTAIEKERKIILEEKRKQQFDDPFYDAKIGIGVYAHRPPLGTIKDIKRITQADLQAYYKKWYHPQLANLIISSNKPIAEIKKMIHRYFAGLSSTKIAPPPIKSLRYPLRSRLYTRFDSLQTNYVLEMIYPYKQKRMQGCQALLFDSRRNLLTNILEHALCHDSHVSVTNQWYLADTYHLVFTIHSKTLNGIINKADTLKAAIRELQKKRLSFLERATTYKLLKKQSKEIKALDSSVGIENIIAYLTDHVLSGDYIVTQKNLVDLLQKNLVATKKTQLNYILRQFFNQGQSPIYALTTPRKIILNEAVKDRILQKQTCLKYSIKCVFAQENVEKQIEHLPPLPVFSPYKGEVRSQFYPDLGLFSYKYPNGIELIAKQIKTADNMANVQIIAPGGINVIPDSLYYRLESAPGYIDMGGFNHISETELSAFADKYQIAMSSTISSFYHGYVAKCNEKFLRELFTIIRSKFAHPYISRRGLEECKREQLKEWKEDTVNIITRMMRQTDDYKITQWKENYLQQIPLPSRQKESKNDIVLLSAHDMEQFYANLFLSTQRMKVVVVSSFPAERVRQIFQTVFASIPFHQFAPYAAPTVKMGERYKDKNSFVVVVKNKKTSTIYNIYANAYEPNLRNILILKLIRNLINTRILKVLRQQAGIVYSPYVYLEYESVPVGRFVYTLENTISPDNYDALEKLITEQIIVPLQKNLVDRRELEDIKRGFISNKKATLNDHLAEGWIKILPELIRKQISLKDYEEYNNVLRSITPKDIQKAVQKYF